MYLLLFLILWWYFARKIRRALEGDDTKRQL